ncbi:MAG: prepilin peptidase [Verrucomicrobia bacterium]|nr:prepilin peptidase [Verrucomicrobiota bacterium]
MPLETLLFVIAFVFGCVWGSFFNVVIYRLPREMSVVKPGSHCFACNTPVAWYDNIPLVSWLVLRGKCRHCGAPFSFRYFIVELITGLLFLAVMMKYIDPIMTKGRTLEGVVALVLHWLMVGGFVVLTFIDFDHKIIPDCVSLPGIVLGLIASFAVPDLVARYRGQVAPEHVSHLKSLLEGAIGMLVGGGSLWIIAVAGRAVFKKEAMGGGDIKLMAMIGAYMGYWLILPIVLISAFTGAIVGVTLIVISQARGARLIKPLHAVAENDPDPAAREKAKAEIAEIEEAQMAWSSQIPFGPYIVLGALIAYFFGDRLIRWYFGLLMPVQPAMPAHNLVGTVLRLLGVS